MSRLVKDGNAWPHERQRLLPNVIEAMVEGVQPAQLAAWKLEEEKNRDAYDERQPWLLSLGHTLIEKWKNCPRADDQLVKALYRKVAEARQRVMSAPP
jgi:hypothetical protein